MKHTPRPPRTRQTQRGAALLMAMIIVTLVVTLAAGMVWQQWRAVQVEAAERARSQSVWILTGALDWARLILREDARTGGADHLGEPWAVPLAEARLSTFLAADKDNTDDAPDAFLSGSISDEHSRYNLSNLIGAGKVIPEELAALERLCQAVGTATDVATRIAEGLRDASAPAGSAGTPGAGGATALLPRDVSQLAWFGVSAEALHRLGPYVTLLPTRTVVNANTAGREVLVATLKGLDLASAERLLQVRQRSHFRTVADVLAQIPGVELDANPPIGVVSNFFEIRGRLRVGDRVLEQRSLVERRGLEVVLLLREQIASRESAGP
ncbi:MAG: type II secretion system minor pseudopilin GspK [Burkholderiaceae bacterium]